MIHNTNQLMIQSKIIAQDKTPIQTGNLRYNAMRAYITPTGFRLTSLFTAAFYGGILDVSKKTSKYRWWSSGVHLAVGAFIKASADNKKSLLQQPNRLVAKFAPDNPQRLERYYNSMVADEGRNKFIAGV